MQLGAGLWRRARAAHRRRTDSVLPCAGAADEAAAGSVGAARPSRSLQGASCQQRGQPSRARAQPWVRKGGARLVEGWVGLRLSRHSLPSPAGSGSASRHGCFVTLMETLALSRNAKFPPGSSGAALRERLLDSIQADAGLEAAARSFVEHNPGLVKHTLQALARGAPAGAPGGSAQQQLVPSASTVAAAQRLLDTQVVAALPSTESSSSLQQALGGGDAGGAVGERVAARRRGVGGHREVGGHRGGGGGRRGGRASSPADATNTAPGAAAEEPRGEGGADAHSANVRVQVSPSASSE
jgi:hypothetical protein